jgi:hypothetical protein
MSEVSRAALVERMARAICLMLGDEPDDPGAEEGPDGYICNSPLWKAYIPTAEASLAIALEEAARIAETPLETKCCGNGVWSGYGQPECCGSPEYRWGDPGEIAAAIRALKSG